MPDRHRRQGTGRTLKDAYIEAQAHAANFCFCHFFPYLKIPLHPKQINKGQVLLLLMHSLQLPSQI